MPPGRELKDAPNIGMLGAASQIRALRTNMGHRMQPDRGRICADEKPGVLARDIAWLYWT